jgi:hypothetical protein
MDGWQTARELLGGPAGPARDAVRWGLEGLRGCLTSALAQSPSDAAGRLLAAIDELLAGRVPGSPPAELAAAPAPGGPLLVSLAEAAEADPRLRGEIGPVSYQIGLTGGGWSVAGVCDPGPASQRPATGLPRADDAEIWAALHWHLLRASEEVAREWRGKAARAAEAAGARVVPATAPGPPLPATEELVPGLAGAIVAPGLRGAGPAAADPLAVVATAAAACAWFAGSNLPGLRHALRSVRLFEVVPLEPPGHAAAYQAEVDRRREVLLAAARTPGPELLKALLDVDEAVQSLLPWPPPAAGSWWGRWRRQARDAVRDARRAANLSGQIRLLAGRFSEIHQLTADNLPVEYGTPGEVVVCLRQHATVGGEELKGRVLYRPQE